MIRSVSFSGFEATVVVVIAVVVIGKVVVTGIVVIGKAVVFSVGACTVASVSFSVVTDSSVTGLSASDTAEGSVGGCLPLGVPSQATKLIHNMAVKRRAKAFLMFIIFYRQLSFR